MIAIVLGYSVLLCFDTLGLDRASARGVAVVNLDRTFTAIFGAEVCAAAGGLQPWVERHALAHSPMHCSASPYGGPSGRCNPHPHAARTDHPHPLHEQCTRLLPPATCADRPPRHGQWPGTQWPQLLPQEVRALMWLQHQDLPQLQPSFQSTIRR